MNTVYMPCNSDLSELYPVILKTPHYVASLKGKEKVKALSDYARKSLFLSLKASGLSLDRLDKGEAGEPLPCNGVYWSISHKVKYVAGLAARFPVGIDIEAVRPVSTALFNKICSRKESALFNWSENYFFEQEDKKIISGLQKNNCQKNNCFGLSKSSSDSSLEKYRNKKHADTKIGISSDIGILSDIIFFRVFTAKEAVLKSRGRGLAHLSYVKVISVPDRMHLLIEYQGEKFNVEQFYLDRHMVSLASIIHRSHCY